ncbi:hypothetical protein MMC06_006595 [Schaereria dolodes]|nr:hypothetical protein [Schaereria dolodes]
MVLGFCTLSFEVQPRKRSKQRVETSISCFPKAPARPVLAELKYESLNRRSLAVIKASVVQKGEDYNVTNVKSRDAPLRDSNQKSALKPTTQVSETIQTTPQEQLVGKASIEKPSKPIKQHVERQINARGSKPLVQPQTERILPTKHSVPKAILKSPKKVSFAALPEDPRIVQEESPSQSSSVSDSFCTDLSLPMGLATDWESRRALPKFSKYSSTRGSQRVHPISKLARGTGRRSVRTQDVHDATVGKEMPLETPFPEYTRLLKKDRNLHFGSRRVNGWSTEEPSVPGKPKTTKEAVKTSAMDSSPEWDIDSEYGSAIDTGPGPLETSLPESKPRSRSDSLDSISEFGSAIDVGEGPLEHFEPFTYPRSFDYELRAALHRPEPIFIYRPKATISKPKGKEPILIYRPKEKSKDEKRQPRATRTSPFKVDRKDGRRETFDVTDNRNQKAMAYRPSSMTPPREVSLSNETPSGLGIEIIR